MKIKPVSLFIFLVPCLFLFASTSAHTVVLKGSANRFLLFSESMKTDTGGRAVRLDSAQTCINRYSALMAAHGFANKAGLPINIQLTKTSLITTGESFIGKDFLDWLNGIATQYSAANKTLKIKIQMGVYDMNYLNTYESDPAVRAAYNNRVAIFVIPYDASTGQAAVGLAQPLGGTGGSGGSGYDLGGVQP
jgi:hypothetical protein